MNNPKVSIILPVYNGEKYLKQAVQSVLWQTFSDFELIIINDGSTDNSSNVIKTFADLRIRVVDQENKGLISTLNIGVEMAKAEYIARIDADDIWSDPNKLAKQVKFLEENPEYVLVGTWAKIIDKTGQKTSVLKTPTTDEEIRNKILIKNGFTHPSVIFSKDACLKAGGFDEQEKYVEDYGLWLRMGLIGKFANIPEYLMSYRVHTGSVTRQKNLAQCKNSLAIIKKHQTQYPNYKKASFKWHLKILLVRIKNLS